MREKNKKTRQEVKQIRFKGSKVEIKYGRFWSSRAGN